MSLRHAMLGLLAQGPASGYDLLGVFNNSLTHVWPATQSQLYTELGRLTDAGLVTVAAEGPRGRKEYEITEAGGTELRRWLTEVTPDQPRRNDALLRVFFLGRLSNAEGRAYLDNRATAAADSRTRLIALRERISHNPSELAVHGRLAVEFGIRMMQTTHDWALWASAELAAEEAAGSGEDTAATGETATGEGGAGAPGDGEGRTDDGEAAAPGDGGTGEGGAGREREAAGSGAGAGRFDDSGASDRASDKAHDSASDPAAG
jgi:PadR family transcriptional regulator AphA